MYESKIEQYKKQTVESMTPGEQLILLYDTAIKNLKAAEIMMDQGDLSNFPSCLNKSRNIFFHLETVLDPDYEISEDLTACYAFFRRQISECLKTHNKECISVIIPQVESLRDGFEEASKKLVQGE